MQAICGGQQKLAGSKMVKGLIALCLVAAVQVCSAYELRVPVFRQPYGVGETRIIGGQAASKGQFPHQAGITMDGYSFCGGSLISKNWVMTAAHCVDGFRQWTVVLGAQKIRETNEPGRITISSDKGIRHEQYSSSQITNDIGLVSLPQDVQFSDTVNIIALPPRSLKNDKLDGKTVRVSGWGKTSDGSSGISPTLQFVDLTLISLDECRKAYGSVPETQYCCSAANQKSTCNGDSGGSLTIGEGANLVNLGIVSYGSARGCAKGYPVGFTATPHFVDWVSNKTGIPIKE